MKVLISGGAGFIGTNLAIRCLNEGWETTIVDNNPEHVNRAKSVIPAKITLDDFASDEALAIVRSEQFDVILHQAAIPRVSYSMEHPAETTDENVLKTVRLLEAAAGNCGRFVFASSSSIYGDTDILPIREQDSIGSKPKSPYAMQKKVCEEFIDLFCREFGLDAISLRYFNVFGPHQYGDSPYATALSSWCYRIKEGLSIRSDGTGEQSRDLCYVDNVVEANILAATNKDSHLGTTVNIACGDRVSNNEILKALGREHTFTVEHAPFRPGDIMHTKADISLAEKEIGYKPIIRFWEGFEKTLEWWRL